MPKMRPDKQAEVPGSQPTDSTASSAAETSEVRLRFGSPQLGRLESEKLESDEQRFMFDGYERFARLRSIGDVIAALETIMPLFDERSTIETAPYVAVEKLGLLALRPIPWEAVIAKLVGSGDSRREDARGKMLQDLEGLRTIIWQQVEHWINQATVGGTLEARRQATNKLKKFGSMLIPSARGRRRHSVAHPGPVYLAYRQWLFRLNLARERVVAGVAPPSTKSRRKVLEEVSAATGLPEEMIRDWIFLEDLTLRERPLSAAETARLHVAQLMGITPESLANLISRSRTRASK